MAKSQKPPKSKKPNPARTARRTRMVGAKLAGKSNKTIARETGLSRDWVAHELASDECRQIITGLVNDQFPRIERLFGLGLTVLEEAFGAHRTVVALGVEVDLGADHFARLTAFRRLMDLVLAGRPTAKLPDVDTGEKTLSLEQFEKLLEESNRRSAK